MTIRTMMTTIRTMMIMTMTVMMMMMMMVMLMTMLMSMMMMTARMMLPNNDEEHVRTMLMTVTGMLLTMFTYFVVSCH